MQHSGGDSASRDTEPLEEVFRQLEDRPTPELDSGGLWRRTEAAIMRSETPSGIVAAPWRWVSVSQLAWGAAALVTASLLLWLAVPRQPPVPAAEIVLLTPAESPAVRSEPSAGFSEDPATLDRGGALVVAPLYLEVRLVRGYDGPAPADVRSAAAAGAGGADALHDVRDGIAALLPFESFGLVGSGGGQLADGATLEISLSSDYRLSTRSIEAVGREGTVRLEGVALSGSGRASTPLDLNLEPGRLYILGVLAAGAEDPELVLLLRAGAGRGGR